MGKNGAIATHLLRLSSFVFRFVSSPIAKTWNLGKGKENTETKVTFCDFYINRETQRLTSATANNCSNSAEERSTPAALSTSVKRTFQINLPHSTKHSADKEIKHIDRRQYRTVWICYSIEVLDFQLPSAALLL